MKLNGMFIIFSIFMLLLPNSFSSLDDHYHGFENPSEDLLSEVLLCRKCGATVLDSLYIFDKISPGARKISKQNLFGRFNITVQSLVNPFGVSFDIITLEKARCKNIGPEQGADSWFPGFTWRICTCPHCAQHLGWTFTSNTNDESEDKITSFHGIILNNVLGEDYSLIMMPKTYRV